MELREGFSFKLENADIQVHADRDTGGAEVRALTQGGERRRSRAQRGCASLGAGLALWYQEGRREEGCRRVWQAAVEEKSWRESESAGSYFLSEGYSEIRGLQEAWREERGVKWPLWGEEGGERREEPRQGAKRDNSIPRHFKDALCLKSFMLFIL